MTQSLYNKLVPETSTTDLLADFGLMALRADMKSAIGDYLPSGANLLTFFKIGNKEGAIFSLNNGEGLILARKVGLLLDRVTLIKSTTGRRLKASDLMLIQNYLRDPHDATILLG